MNVSYQCCVDMQSFEAHACTRACAWHLCCCCRAWARAHQTECSHAEWPLRSKLVSNFVALLNQQTFLSDCFF